MSYYDTLANAEMHPMRIAYRQFETDKAVCITSMKCNEVSHRAYLDSESRLERLKHDQAELVKVMPDDLTADILITTLKG